LEGGGWGPRTSRWKLERLLVPDFPELNERESSREV